MDLRDPVRVGRRLGLRHQRRPLEVGFQHRVDETGPRRRRLLCHPADPRPLRHLDLAESSASSPWISLKSVVLPLPLRPTNPTLCPAGIVAEASSKSFLPSIEKVRLRSASMRGDVPRALTLVNAGSFRDRSRDTDRSDGVMIVK